jgi:hypothetical protein
MMPLYPVQPDRQPTYPKALGPVFIGNPLRLIPSATPKASQGTSAPVGRFRSQEADGRTAQASTRPSYLQPPTQEPAASRNPTLGAQLDVLA